MGHGLNAGQWRHKNSWLAARFLAVSCATVGGLRRAEQRDITSVRRGREAEMECSMFAAADADPDGSPCHRFSLLSYSASLDLSVLPRPPFIYLSPFSFVFVSSPGFVSDSIHPSITPVSEPSPAPLLPLLPDDVALCNR